MNAEDQRSIKCHRVRRFIKTHCVRRSIKIHCVQHSTKIHCVKWDVLALAGLKSVRSDQLQNESDL